jgi:hypothetical protein
MPLKLTGFAALRQPHSNDAAVLTTGPVVGGLTCPREGQYPCNRRPHVGGTAATGNPGTAPVTSGAYRRLAAVSGITTPVFAADDVWSI